jgi:hypothetical protein
MGNVARNTTRIAQLPPPPLCIEAPAAELLADDGLATYPLLHEEERAGGWLVVNAAGQAVEMLYKPWSTPFTREDEAVQARFLRRRYRTGAPQLPEPASVPRGARVTPASAPAG